MSRADAGSRLVAPALTVLAACCLALVPSAAGAQISPGPLAAPHAGLEGALNCVQCHGPRKGSMSASCLACHRDVGWLRERDRGFHAGREVRGRECAACHPDHAGAGFALIAWPGGKRDSFDHGSAGWALEGGHRDLRCEECHATEYRVSDAARLSKRTRVAGWMGLETTCVSCHREDDPHRGALDARCETCHDSRAWEPAPRFTHDDTDYPLTGEHARVACAECHLAPRLPIRLDAAGKPVPVYAPVPFRSCGDCHDDPHRGRFSTRCAECHTTEGFAVAEGRSFKHALTRYPLQGRHARVDCAACHGRDLATPKPAFDACGSCHSDPHRGEAVLAGTPRDCAACHRVDGFAPSTYTVAQHASAPYPLEGRHAGVSCVKCHAKPAARSPGTTARAVARLRMPFTRCADCHADVHAGQLAARPDQGACESCHAVAGWAPSTFASHARTRLPLEGRHAEVPCRACHGGDRPSLPPPAPRASLGTAGVSVTLASAACGSCHVDPHAGRYAPPAGAMATAGDCGACHTAVAFRPSRVDAAWHARFTFALEGAHRAVSCSGCHEELRSAPATATLLGAARGVARFPAAPGPARRCVACHDNPHGAQFAGRRGGDACETCHGVVAFAPAPGFDHDRQSAFPLAGAHATVPCASCHPSAVVDGRAMSVYRPISTRCESCHDRRVSS